MSLFACSGFDGPPEVIGKNIEIGYMQAEVMFRFVLLSLMILAFRPRRIVVPASLRILLALHPAWTISAISGDCGYLKRDAAYVFTAIGGAALIVQVVWLLWNRVFLRS